MIVLTFKDEKGKEIEQKLIVDAEMIQKNETLKEYLWEIWNDRYNECICTLHEGQSYCECDGIYGSNTGILKIEDRSDYFTKYYLQHSELFYSKLENERLSTLIEELRYKEPKKTLLERAVRAAFTLSLFFIFCTLAHYSKAEDTLMDIIIFLFFIGLIDVSNLICDFYSLFVKDNTKGSK